MLVLLSGLWLVSSVVVLPLSDAACCATRSDICLSDESDESISRISEGKSVLCDAC